MELGNIIETCTTNVGGTGTEVLYAPVSFFDELALATPESTATTADQIVSITAAHTFIAGKGFRSIEVLLDTGAVESNSVGDIGGKSFEHMCKGFVPNNSPLNAGILSKLASCKWIFLVPEVNAGVTVYRQIGSKQRAAYCEDNSYKSGEASSDRRGTSIAFKSSGHSTHSPFYTGTITMHP